MKFTETWIWKKGVQGRLLRYFRANTTGGATSLPQPTGNQNGFVCNIALDVKQFTCTVVCFAFTFLLALSLRSLVTMETWCGPIVSVSADIGASLNAVGCCCVIGFRRFLKRCLPLIG